MKKIMIALLVLSSVNAFATKARMKALSSSFHLSDTQTIYTSPYQLFSFKDFVALESGAQTPTGADDGAEGAVLFSISDEARLFVSLGHKDEAVQNERKFLNAVDTVTFKTQQNPLEVMYGMKMDGSTYGIGFFYSQFKDKVADNNESSNGIRVGGAHGDFKWKINLGLTNKVQNTTDGTLTGNPYTNVALRYNMNTLRYGLDYVAWDVKRSSTADVEVSSHSFQNIKLQVVDTQAKDGHEFFYGAALDQTNLKNKLNDKVLTRLALPVWMGLETAANDWLTLRASIKQSVLLAQSKDENGYTATSTSGVDGAFGAVTEYSAEPNNTVAAFGAGLRWNQLTVDGTLSGLTGGSANQKIDATNLLAQVGMTYNY